MSFECNNFGNNYSTIHFFFFQNVLNFMHISEMDWKIPEKSFLFEIKAFEVVVRKSAYCDGLTKRLKLLSENLLIATGILVIGSQRVNKQSEDFRYD